MKNREGNVRDPRVGTTAAVHKILSRWLQQCQDNLIRFTTIHRAPKMSLHRGFFNSLQSCLQPNSQQQQRFLRLCVLCPRRTNERSFCTSTESSQSYWQSTSHDRINMAGNLAGTSVGLTRITLPQTRLFAIPTLSLQASRHVSISPLTITHALRRPLLTELTQVTQGP